MKSFSEYVRAHRQLSESDSDLEKKIDELRVQVKDASDRSKAAEKQAKNSAEAAERAQKEADKVKNKAQPTIHDEESFRDAARAKFEKVFGDNLDEKKFTSIIDGILKKNKEDVDAGNWGKLIGLLNKSFGH